MRYTAFLGVGFSLASLFSAVAADSTDPKVVATAAFPEENTFNHLVNGQKNTLTVTIENKSGLNVTLLNIAGSLTHPDTNALLKNITALKYGVPLLEKSKVQVPYNFYSEFRPGDHRLNLWLQHSVGDKVYTVDVFESVVTVVEPPVSIFDLKMLATYLILLGLFGGAGYYTYITLAPPKKKSKVPTPSAPVGTVTATGAGGYQEEWIPEHHLKKSKSAKKAGGVTSGTSADEFSGAELSGTEGRRRKGKK
ncbi:hypothetical protein DFP72DRAFT_1066035 [Ephemerocybe angulata]|uniref:Translocon-associated protein subunit alpha n=1 Tax=Ephemerocybe angulata TaxID=980116 RepID=A0A8H6M9M8_9AGAR|nr:hypothetical protein DFP72DRAFT_1066035 [Tulosesus angulatus]